MQFLLIVGWQRRFGFRSRFVISFLSLCGNRSLSIGLWLLAKEEVCAEIVIWVWKIFSHVDFLLDGQQCLFVEVSLVIEGFLRGGCVLSEEFFKMYTFATLCVEILAVVMKMLFVIIIDLVVTICIDDLVFTFFLKTWVII